ncbi:hypothetical protein TTHERM_000727807 (macronuclear) [Tetrahymena thermophila SB210]|uniref:Uncharacterized protein n=1 Tax=Tetrahymena thermophila (strain SB210) TaxID=312017 RepID=W7X8D3_TETTS|nr:hypothetical protein TTHERM_000727807 [Tetrahymena thermophila SB210]EWS72668.1 hypothetical protein TTHERM_000727807 [Tetrahymena thermophila SB210]|eukprot:XP_012654793.1 hypothetical protein TTHERM_000727807 [Tetrahymena thermophila SB210]
MSFNSQTAIYFNFCRNLHEYLLKSNYPCFWLHFKSIKKNKIKVLTCKDFNFFRNEKKFPNPSKRCSQEGWEGVGIRMKAHFAGDKEQIFSFLHYSFIKCISQVQSIEKTLLKECVLRSHQRQIKNEVKSKALEQSEPPCVLRIVQLCY